MTTGCTMASLAQAGSSWAPFGTAGFSTGVADYTSITVSRQDSSIYVAFKDIANGNKVTVMRSSNGGAWTVIGNAGFSAGAVDHVSIAVHNSRPMVAFKDYSNGGRLSIMRWNGTAWAYVGNPGAQSSGEVNAVSLCAAGARDRFMVAYTDEADGNKVYVRLKEEGSNGAFAPLGPAQASSGAASFVKIVANDILGYGYLMFTDSANAAKATVRTFESFNWVTVGTAGFTAGTATHNDIAVTHDGHPIAVYRDGSTSNRASVSRWNGTNWALVGSAGLSAGTAEFNSILIDETGQPIVAYKDGTNNGRASARRFNGTSWSNYGTAGFTSGSAEFIELAGSGSYGPFMVCKDAGLSGKIVVEAFSCTNPTAPVISPTSGTFCGGEGILLSTSGQANTQMRWYRQLTAATIDSVGNSRVISPQGPVQRVAIAFDKAGTLYCAYTFQNDAYVVRRVAGAWQQIGGVALSSVDEIDLAIHPVTNEAYIIAETTTGSRPIVVRRFNGTSWVTLQAPDAGPTSYVDIAFAGGGTLYASYQRNVGGNVRVGLMRYEGPLWYAHYQSSAPGAAPDANFGSIAISSSGIPMVASSGPTLSFHTLNRTIVNTAEWLFKTAVNTPTNFCRLALGRGDEAFIAYRQTSNNQLYLVRRSGNAQDTSGVFHPLGGSVSNGAVSRFDMAIDQDGTPYVIYADSSLGNKLQLKKWNGSNWVTAGGASFSVGSAIDPHLAFDANNTTHALYVDNGLQGSATLVLPDRLFVQAANSYNANRGGSYQISATAGCATNVLSNTVALTQTDAYNSWIGGVNGAWATAGNWSCGRVPTANDLVRIPATPGAIYPFAQGSTTAFVCAGLMMEPGARLDVNGDAVLRIFGTLDLRGNARINTVGTVRVLVPGGIN